MISVGPQVFDLLVYLVQHRDRVVSKDDLFEAVWNGRIVSESTLTTHINAVRKAVGDTGEDQNLIRTVPRKGFRFVGEVREQQTSNEQPSAIGASPGLDEATYTPVLSLPDKPSIAVLPFQNLSGDPEQEYFADGMVEDIITALSRLRWLFVIARNSSFTYKGRAVDVKQVGRELGVRYIVEGGVRRALNRVRITTQLIDAATSAHIWADRFDGTLDDIFDIQDRVAASVVGAIARRLEQAEIERARHKPTQNLDAYDFYLRGMAYFHQRTREAFNEALPLFHKAIELDPQFASASGMAAQCYFWRKANGWMADRVKETAEGARLARRAVELGEDDAIALTRGGHSLAHLTGDFDTGIAFIDQALLLNPNLATAWYLGGTLRAFRGEPDVASEHLAHAIRLSPLDPEMFRIHFGIACAQFVKGAYDEASLWAEKGIRALPSFVAAISVTAVCYAHAGRLDEARNAVQRLQGYLPTLRISNLKEWWLPWQRQEELTRWIGGLRKAGLPE